MRSETQILTKIDELKKKVFDTRTSRRVDIQEMVIWVKVLEWVLENEVDIVKQRLEKIRIDGTVSVDEGDPQ